MNLQPQFLSKNDNGVYQILFYSDPGHADHVSRLFIVYELTGPVRIMVGYGMLYVVDDDSEIEHGVQMLGTSFDAWPSEMKDSDFISLPPDDPQIMVGYTEDLHADMDTGELSTAHTLYFDIDYRHMPELEGYVHNYVAEFIESDMDFYLEKAYSLS